MSGIASRVQRASGMRRVFTVALCCCILAGCGGGIHGLVEHPLVDTRPTVKRMPTLRHGLVVVPSPGKVTILEFWETFCKPCKEQLPELQRLSDDLRGRAQVYSANGDDNPGRVEQEARRLGLEFPVIFDGQYRVLFGQYRVEDVPRTFVFDRNGTLRYVIGEIRDAADVAAILADKLLSEDQ